MEHGGVGDSEEEESVDTNEFTLENFSIDSCSGSPANNTCGKNKMSVEEEVPIVEKKRKCGDDSDVSNNVLLETKEAPHDEPEACDEQAWRLKRMPQQHLLREMVRNLDRLLCHLTSYYFGMKLSWKYNAEQQCCEIPKLSWVAIPIGTPHFAQLWFLGLLVGV